MPDFGDENLVQCANSNGFQCPPSGDDGGGGGDETIQDCDSGAGTGGVDITCALASFIVTVIDVEEKGYDGVLALAGRYELTCRVFSVRMASFIVTRIDV
ncbi:hypothetical protein BDN72DRAFT_840615 [Pluteus cervinus]|uniref:Uncharacterized protein n=1 Tax=Pluteus cervinus TaxID=181527 RepID=A0ACD3AUL3_9AGAR|nr:hypothetical protein BDN72DRAFT_840615 [Pluteus cervinus]